MSLQISRGLALPAVILAGLLMACADAEAEPAPRHGLAIHGEPGYPADFKHFAYVNPNAPKGGTVTLEASGSFDSFNAHILKGTPAGGIGLLYETLMTNSQDEASTAYGLLAETVEVPADRSWAIFNLQAGARWHDGKPITAEDVIWTFETLTRDGHPFYRAYYADVAKVEALGERRVKFTFKGEFNNELPFIVGEITVLPKHYWQGRNFTEPTLEPPLGSGPYKVKSFEAGRRVVYERVKDYWGADLAVNKGENNFDEIRFEYFRDREVATEAFKGGAFDFRAENSAKRWATQFDFPAVQQGMVKKELIENDRPTGMQGFLFNTRRPLFKDRKVRQALAYAFDFEWTNKTLMYDAYARTESYFANSELASSGLPGPDELALLETWRGKVPDEVFTKEYKAPATDGSGNIRANLREALKLLGEAGWTVKDGVLKNAAGTAFAFEILLVSPASERIALPFQQNLKRLGIEMSVRTVDPAQYQNRLDSFDFDMIIGSIGQSLSPGNEQRDFWHSSKVDQPGSRNLMGIADPAVDDLVQKIINAPDRKALVTRTRALDRVLLWGHYLIPQFHITADRIVYWDKFGRPATLPRYASGGGFPSLWWYDEAKAAKLEAWKKNRTN